MSCIHCSMPYAASKISADQLSLSYYKSFNLPIKIIRPFNTYGPRQSSRAIQIIYNALTKVKNDFRYLNPTRDFNYVEDTCLDIFQSLKIKVNRKNNKY